MRYTVGAPSVYYSHATEGRMLSLLGAAEGRGKRAQEREMLNAAT